MKARTRAGAMRVSCREDMMRLSSSCLATLASVARRPKSAAPARRLGEQDAERGQAPLEREHEDRGEQQIHQGLEAPRNPGRESVLKGGTSLEKRDMASPTSLWAKKSMERLLQVLEHAALPQEKKTMPLTTFA